MVFQQLQLHRKKSTRFYLCCDVWTAIYHKSVEKKKVISNIFSEIFLSADLLLTFMTISSLAVRSRVICSTCIITVFPVKPWTPEKISGMFIVSRPIRCEMKPQKITGKPQNGLITTWHETTSSLLLPRRIFTWLFINTAFLSLFQLCCHQSLDMNDILRKSEVNQEDRIRHS